MAKLDTSRMWKKIRALEEIGHEAESATAKALAEYFIDKVSDLTPNDTNRAENGWLQAGRAAGVTDRPLKPYQASSRREDFLKKLEHEIEQMSDRVARDEAMIERYRAEDAKNAGTPTKSGKPRKRRVDQPYFKTMQSRLRKNTRRLRRLNEEYRKALGSEAFIFFDADSPTAKGKRYFSTVRDKIYGGSAEVIRKRDSVFYEFTNHEPHIKVIEAHPHLGHPIKTAQALTKTVGRNVARGRWIAVHRNRSKFLKVA